MLEQIGVAIKFYGFFTATKVGKSGLTDVVVDVYRAGTGIVANAVATTVGGGWYSYTLASGSVTVEGEYIAVFKTADGTVDFQHVTDRCSVGTAGVEHLDADIADVPVVVWDEVLTGGTHNITNSAGRRLRTLDQVGAYEGGAVWIDTVNGAAGTVLYTNGTVDNPSNNFADALNIADQANLREFMVRNGSIVTLSGTVAGRDFIGEQWSLILGAGTIDISGCFFHGATIDVSGTAVAVGNPPLFEHCRFGTLSVTLPPCLIYSSMLQGSIIMGSAGLYTAIDCISRTEAVGATEIVFPTGNATFRLHKFSGSVTIKNMAAGDNFSINGDGRLLIDSSCTGGVILGSGNLNLTNNGTGQTIVDTALINVENIADQVWDEALAAHVAAGTAAQFLNAAGGAADPLLNAVPGAYLSGTAGFALGRIGTADITVQSPVAVDGTTLELVRGDDYLAAQGRQLTFTSTTWPNLTGATIRLTIRRRREAFGSGSDPILMELTDVYASRVAGVGSQTVVFEITAANSVALLPGTATGKYDIEARLPLVAPSASPSPSPSVGEPVGTVVTLAVGVVNCIEDQTR
jgi:hypothetical protein